jgi:hypothetical protein
MIEVGQLGPEREKGIRAGAKRAFTVENVKTSHSCLVRHAQRVEELRVLPDVYPLYAALVIET